MSKEKIPKNSERETVEISQEEILALKKKAPAHKNFGRYNIVHQIGEGSGGRVFLAIDRELNRQVALKELWPSKNNNVVDIARFRREAKAIAKLRHPNIVAIHDIGLEKENYYFTMDYIDGTTLDMVLQTEGTIFPDKAAYVICRLAKALYAAHKTNIIHRDIKPSNIMVDKSLEPYLMDFGLARDIAGNDRLSRSGVIMGTPGYMPPEQARGEKELDGRADVYALGATFYEMLVGQLMFEGKDMMDLIHKIIHQSPTSLRQINPQIPRDLEKICLKALEKSKDKRYPNALVMAQKLEQYLQQRKQVPNVASKKVSRLQILILPLTIAMFFLWNNYNKLQKNKYLLEQNQKQLKETKEKVKKIREELQKLISKFPKTKTPQLKKLQEELRSLEK